MGVYFAGHAQLFDMHSVTCELLKQKESQCRCFFLLLEFLMIHTGSVFYYSKLFEVIHYSEINSINQEI